MKLNGMSIPKTYQGVVEDRSDPLGLGRVRVRVLGVHSEDVSLVPTEDLPWATVRLGINSAGISGIGWSPTGLALGSWVDVEFMDGESLQIPRVIGVSVGINPMSKVSSTGDSTTTVTSPLNITSQSAASTAINNSSWKSDSKVEVASTPKAESELGSVSEEYESNGNPGAANPDPNPNAGWSYGAWQLNGDTLKSYVNQSKFKSDFSGLAPGSAEFTKKWKDVAQRDAAGFKADQKDFIYKNNYTNCLNKTQYLADRGEGVQNAIWSVSVQHGATGGASVINKALAGQDLATLSDADICVLIKDYQSNNVQTLFKKTPAAWTTLQNRYSAEKAKLVKMCPDSTTGAKLITPEKDEYNQDKDPGEPKYTQPAEKKPLKIGFVDPTGKLPRKGYLGQPDTNRLALARDLDQTYLGFKEKTRLVGNGYSEPKSPYAAKYPHNSVFMSEAGHVIEIDNTPNGERIHVWHKSGSYIEFQPDGTIVKKSYKDDHEIVLGEDKTYVTGNMSVFVEGNVSLKSLGNISMEAAGNISIMAGGSMSLGSKSAMSLATNAGMSHTASGVITQNGSRITQNNGGGSAKVKVDVGAKLKVLSEYALEDTSAWTNDSPGKPGSKEDIIKETGIVPDSSITPVQPQTKSVNKEKPGVKSAINFLEENPQLSEHFWLSDLTTSAVFAHKLTEQAGLTREELISNLQDVAVNVLEPLVARYGRDSFIITSAFRPATGGTSQHHLGQAVDVQFPGQEMVHIANESSKAIPSFDQMILEYHGKNPVLHISYNSNNRKQAFTTFTSSFKPITPYGFYDSQMNPVYIT